jgi:hypothetical protein
MKTKLLAAAFVAGLPAVTLAQGIQHLGSEFGLGYAARVTGESADSYDGPLVSIKTDWALGANFGLQLNGMARDLDSVSIQTYGLHGWYQLSPAFRLGAFAQQNNVSVSGAPVAFFGRQFGLEALVEPTENAAIQVYVGTGRNDFGFIGQRADLTTYGISATYDFTPTLSGRISFDHGEQAVMGNTITSQLMGFGVDWRTKGFGSTPMTIAFDYSKVSSIYDDGGRLSVTAKINFGGKAEQPRRLFDNRYSPNFTMVF